MFWKFSKIGNHIYVTFASRLVLRVIFIINQVYLRANVTLENLSPN